MLWSYQQPLQERKQKYMSTERTNQELNDQMEQYLHWEQIYNGLDYRTDMNTRAQTTNTTLDPTELNNGFSVESQNTWIIQ